MHDSRSLDIRTVSARTRLSPTALRMWEERYGFPQPERDRGGHRRYSERDVALLQQVVRYRTSGMSLKAAISRVRGDQVGERRSVYALLHRQWRLQPRQVSARSLAPVMRAVEDEIAMGAERATIVASFPSDAALRAVSARWRQMTSTAEQALSMGPTITLGRRSLTPHIVLDAHEPLAQETFRVCDADHLTICLTARTLPPAEGASGPPRYELLWTTDPGAVRAAALLCLRRGAAAMPALDAAVQRLEDRQVPDSDADMLAALAQRLVGYLVEEIDRPAR